MCYGTKYKLLQAIRYGREVDGPCLLDTSWQLLSWSSTPCIQGCGASRRARKSCLLAAKGRETSRAVGWRAGGWRRPRRKNATHLHQKPTFRLQCWIGVSLVGKYFYSHSVKTILLSFFIIHIYYITIQMFFLDHEGTVFSIAKMRVDLAAWVSSSRPVKAHPQVCFQYFPVEILIMSQIRV